MKQISNFLLLLISFWAVNCSAADGQKKHHIKIQKMDDGITFGILMTELNDKDKEKLQADYGARVVDVIEGSAAEKAGLKDKDVIVSFNGEKIETAKELDKIVEAMDEGEEVSFKALRDGQELSFEATLKKLEKKGYSYAFSDDEDVENFTWSFSDGEESEVSWFPRDGFDKDIIVENIHGGPGLAFSDEANKGGFLGIEGENLSQQMLEYFEVKHGVLVEKVLKDTPAEASGLKAGDVITHIEGRKIEDYNDLIRTLNYYNPDEKVEIQFVRKGSEKNVEVTLSEKKKNNFFFRNEGGTKVFESEDGPRVWMGKGLKDIHVPDVDVTVDRIFYII